MDRDQITTFLFSSPEFPLLDQAGGKALALSQMTRAGLPVPPGFVLSVAFFAPWLRMLQTLPAWAALAGAAGDELLQAAGALQQACRALQFTEQQHDELRRALQALSAISPARLFAVRSSSPEEDLDGASFAGGYETTLGVTVEGLPAAILRSFASAFDGRVFLYKKEHGFALDQPRIAVIVQQQIDAASAGVAFSLNPLNNCYDEALINANYGLGESVVSGAAEPDAFVVDKLARQVRETRLGGKQTRITLDPAGGVIKSSPLDPPAASLTPAQVLVLSDLLLQVEAYFQKPVDIEWALAGGQFYLLQARPITAYLPLPEEMLTPPGQPKVLYANSTLIEQGVEQPLSVLGTDFLGYVLKQVGGAIGAEGIGPGGMTFTAGGGYYMNLSYALKMGMGKAALAPGSFGDPRVMAILDSIDLEQYLSVPLPARLKALQGKMLFTMLPMLKAVLVAYLSPEAALRKYQAALPQEIQRLEAFSGAGLSLSAQASALCDLLPFFYGENGIPMILAGQIAQQRIKNLFKWESAQAQDHLVNLGIALPGNKTTEMGEMMYRLASAAELQRYDSAADFLRDLKQGSLPADFTRSWRQFMTEFGMRCPGEIDIATPRPVEQPALLFEQLKNMALALRAGEAPGDFFAAARAKRQAAYQALYALALQKGKRQARALEKYSRAWTMLGGYRETPKHYVIKVVSIFRRQALQIAHSLVQQGRLDAPEQIFDLTLADVERAQQDPTLDLRRLAQERTALTRKIQRSRLTARVIDSRGRIYTPPRLAAAEGEWVGVPISPGLARGRVKVFQSAQQKKLLPGEILVARAADPGWTPLFINAAGILLEIGGALQHGAVVAREYGIPCVSGLDEATSRLHDGQLVEVDGSRGVVRILDDSPTV